jgi:hypothetical protein
MTAPGGDNPHDDAAPFHPPEQPRPWEQYPHPPVDPQAPVNDPPVNYPPANYPPTNYPEYPSPYPPPPPGPSYGFPPPPPAGPPGYGGPPPGYGPPVGYGGPPGYPVPYDPYSPYPGVPPETNGMAIASLVTSLAAIPLTALCGIGALAAIVGAVLGIVALNQIKQTHQQGRGLAIGGLVVGTVTAVLPLVFWLFVMTTAWHS